MDAGEVVSSYHELWHVEQSFRMSKHDLPARPVFHHTINLNGHHLTAADPLTPEAEEILTALNIPTGH